MKEIKFRPKIGAGDFEMKTRKVEWFLAGGHTVKVVVMFRGRETMHPELGRRVLDHVAARAAHVGVVEEAAALDGRNMVMVLAPSSPPTAGVPAMVRGPRG